MAFRCAEWRTVQMTGPRTSGLGWAHEIGTGSTPKALVWVVMGMWSLWVNSGSGMSSGSIKNAKRGVRIFVDKQYKIKVDKHDNENFLTWFCPSLLVDWILQGRLSRFFELVHVFNPNILVVEKCGGIDCGCHDRRCSCGILHWKYMTTLSIENQRKTLLRFVVLKERVWNVVTNLSFPPFSATKNLGISWRNNSKLS